jgi:hypothetical protein
MIQAKEDPIVLTSPQDIRQLKQVTDTLFFVLDRLTEDAKREPVIIPYRNFPSSVEVSEVQRALHWVFSICGLRVVKADVAGFWFDFSSRKTVDSFYKYKESINRRYDKLPKEESGTEKLERTEEQEEKVERARSSETLIKNGMGHFRFNKRSKWIEVGGESTRHFRLLQFLCDPLGVARTIDSVFETIKLPKDSKDTALLSYDSHQVYLRKKALITFTKKEIQKIPNLKGRLRFPFNRQQKTYRLKIL